MYYRNQHSFVHLLKESFHFHQRIRSSAGISSRDFQRSNLVGGHNSLEWSWSKDCVQNNRTCEECGYG